MTQRIFGQVPGYPEGSWFASRVELSRAGLHRPRRAGISGRGQEGADSVVLSGGYEDVEDGGNEILYTGHGGRDDETQKQISHQRLTKGNLALAYNRLLGLPVRVIRGSKLVSSYAPESGYRYDGLYRVDDYWRQRGRSGFIIWRYRLVKLPVTRGGEQDAEKDVQMDATASSHRSTILRVVYETEAGRQVKMLYHYRCQLCEARLETPAGPYVEAAHIRPLSAPHNGPDTPDNLLCLCANHHILFERGGIAVNEDFTLLGQEGRLRVDFRHQINKAHLRYHREHYWVDPDGD
jgi:putative restriction endonuclease